MGRIKDANKKIYLSSKRKSRRNVALRSKVTTVTGMHKKFNEEQTCNIFSTSETMDILHKTESIPGCSYWQDDINIMNCEQFNNEKVSDIPNTSQNQVLITTEIVPEGRRIVDIAFIFQQIKNISKHTPFDCTIADMYIIKELRRGLRSSFTLKCRMCGIENILNSDHESEDKVDINSALTLATVSTGVGYSTADEILSVLNIPVMSPKTYQDYHAKVAHVIHDAAWKGMEEAAIEEATIARSVGEVDKDNIPCITVVADGAWCKRSYNVNYDSSSGVACIIGQQTGKVLFLGVRNKYCCICARAERKKIAVDDHLCYKNWNGTSTSMESDIIVEGFKRSLQMYGIKYLKLVGDGDSSVHKKLLEARPYGNVLVQKIECKNHLLRNFSTRIREICTRKRSNSKNVPVPPVLRKATMDNMQRMRTAILMSIQHRRKEDSISFMEKVNALTKDLKNIPSHIFGEHKLCLQLGYFKCSKKGNEKNIVPEMTESGIYQDLETCFNRLIYNASSLINNMDTNIAEQYNSIVCKFVGGKRVNFSLKGSYQVRCEGAASSFNAKGDYHRVIQKALANRSPSAFLKKYTDRIKNKRRYYEQRRKCSRQLFKKGIKRKIALPDTDYGLEASIDPDLPIVEYEQKREIFLRDLKKCVDGIQELEKKTRGQGGNSVWQQERLLRLTASNFGNICKMRKSTSCVNKVKNLLYTKFMGNEHTKYGTEKEPFALNQFEKEFNLEVQPCGLFIDEEDGIFGASPDGLVGENEIIEIKCPSTASRLAPIDAIKSKVLKFVTLDEMDNLKLKQNHNYYYQIQGQLHVTKRDLCYFIVWTPMGMLVEKIQRDDDFWKNNMEHQLKSFYYNCLLPELIDPRHPRGLQIRNKSREKF